jgi:CRP-like cAMP-binding protein
MTDFEEKTRRLSETAAFREMPLEMLGEIAQVVEDRVIPAKTLLFKRGDPGDSFWVIQTGKVRVFRRDDKGTEITFDWGRGRASERWLCSRVSPARRVLKPWKSLA